MTTSSVETTPLVTSCASLMGRVKWFNNKAGYGFITITDGAKSGTDVFVHHSSIKVASEQYRYLVQGEYVVLQLVHTPGGKHEYQSGDVCGINLGKLMCETRHESKQMRTTYKQAEGSSSVETTPVLTRTNSARGAGPRDGAEWTAAKKTTTDVKRGRGRPPKATVSTDL